jgi:hypothetical protein
MRLVVMRPEAPVHEWRLSAIRPEAPVGDSLAERERAVERARPEARPRSVH